MYSEANWMGYSECTSPEGVVRRGESRSAIWTPLRAAPFPPVEPSEQRHEVPYRLRDTNAGRRPRRDPRSRGSSLDPSYEATSRAACTVAQTLVASFVSSQPRRDTATAGERSGCRPARSWVLPSALQGSIRQMSYFI
jgi:hypothetical protein